MPTYVAKYLVTYLDTVPYEAHPKTTINIAGQTITQTDWSLTFGGINKYEFQGLVELSTLSSNERFQGNSWDPVGTTFYSLTDVVIDDPTQIPSQYLASQFGQTGPGGVFSFLDSDHTGIRFGAVHYDVSTDVAGSLTYNNLTVGANDTIYTLAENAMANVGLSGLSTAIKNVASVKTALDHVVTGGMGLVKYGIEHIDDPYGYYHGQFDAMASAYFKDSADTFNDALISQTLYPGNPTLEQTADTILRGVQLVGMAGRDGSIPLSAAVQFGLAVNVADTLHLSATITGTAASEVIIEPAKSGTIDAGAGNDYIFAGPGVDRIIGGAGNDYAFGGRGDDVFVAGASIPYFAPNGNGGLTATAGDFYNGGIGSDTAQWAGNLNTYFVKSSGSGIADIFDWSTFSGTTVKSIENLQFADGTVETYSSNPNIDNLYYDSSNIDVFHAGIDPATHYHLYGWKEGRNPNTEFNTSGYLGANSDVAHANVDPLQQYDLYGWKEGRDSSATFDTRLYLLHNPDVAAANINPLTHYLQYGLSEGRQAYGAIGTSIAPNGFDAEYYLLNNPDVAAAGVNPFQHYETYGWKEGRNPNGFFDTDGYLNFYPDVKAAGINPLDHYHKYGWQEGRDASEHFDTDYYLLANPDVAAAHIDPLLHYLQDGAYEMRTVYDDGFWGHSTVVVSLDI
ncbi:MAG: hypothetical protein EOS55_27995 [Mesorhizobium sp.]|nr:MAG: hypothetical protein EOS55_27995 [Mesorhizobium sp.]